MGTDLSDILEQSRPPVGGATVVREFVVKTAVHEAGQGGRTDE